MQGPRLPLPSAVGSNTVRVQGQSKSVADFDQSLSWHHRSCLSFGLQGSGMIDVCLYYRMQHLRIVNLAKQGMLVGGMADLQADVAAIWSVCRPLVTPIYAQVDPAESILKVSRLVMWPDRFYSLGRAGIRSMPSAAHSPWQRIAADSLDAALDVGVERVRFLQQLVVTGARCDERRPDRLAVANEERKGMLAICRTAKRSSVRLLAARLRLASYTTRCRGRTRAGQAADSGVPARLVEPASQMQTVSAVMPIGEICLPRHVCLLGRHISTSGRRVALRAPPSAANGDNRLAETLRRASQTGPLVTGTSQRVKRSGPSRKRQH